ncbi:MAG TPA: hypothetical protein VIL50_06265 [Candidatus Limnocylindrales bacterium]|jgi:hypothetical protein
MPDGTEFDITAYDEWGVLLSFRRLTDGQPQFIDFVIFPDSAFFATVPISVVGAYSKASRR